MRNGSGPTTSSKYARSSRGVDDAVKCRVCRGRAVIAVRRHNAGFCKDHFIAHIHRQVERTISDYGMFGHGERLLLGVSGGKDSLALWEILTVLGHEVDGVYLHLGIGDYSSDGLRFSQEFAARRELSLEVVDLEGEHGFSVPQASEVTARVACSACGLSKRYLLNEVAFRRGYDVLVVGHNLDDEAAVLWGNVLRWQVDYLSRQRPVLPASEEGLLRKVKPLVRVAERETAAYAVLRGIDYEIEECPMASGNTINRNKEWLNLMEERSPGLKAQFLFGFLDRGAAYFPPNPPDLAMCGECGQPTPGELCAFCRLKKATVVRIADRRSL
ncbi:MAG: adenine nucleotide alpha hydrolase family protein [Acidimicrobiia bacterium]|nr:adenine nucleotide alpha hydrolase family protein [Acidimicrobiia bacterium]